MEQIYLQVGLTIAALIILLLFRAGIRAIVSRHAKLHDMGPSRRVYANKFFNFVFVVLSIILLGIIWDISFKGLRLYLASFAALAGVALFAQWSIISSFTASIILFFNSPFKIGSRIKILDGNDSVEGEIKDITLFSLYILTDEKELISYPNNLILQKPIMLKPDENASH